MNGHDIGSRRNDVRQDTLSVRTEKSKAGSASSTPKNVNSNYSRVIRMFRNQKKKQSRNHAKEKLIPTSSHNDKIRREVRLKMSQKGIFEYFSAFSKRIMRELYLTPKKSFQRNRQRVSKNSLLITYSIESIFSEQTKNIACITFKIKIFGRKNMITYMKSPAILFCMPPWKTTEKSKNRMAKRKTTYVFLSDENKNGSNQFFFFSNILVMMVKDVSIHNSFRYLFKLLQQFWERKTLVWNQCKNETKWQYCTSRNSLVAKIQDFWGDLRG